jgi:uncharacterized membrane protein YfcA
MWRRSALGSPVTSFNERYSRGGWIRLLLAGVVVGFLTGFFGIGGGFLVVPVLVLMLGVPMHLAVGTSLLIIALNALWGLSGNLQLGTLDLAVTMPFALGGGAGVLLGTRVAGRLPERLVRNAFALLVAGVAMYTLGRSAPALLAG